MKTNTLVTHNKFKTLGIGCVSKILPKSVQVNFGTQDVKTCSINSLTAIDTSECKTITFEELKKQTILNTIKDNYVIIGNELKKYVGIGLITYRVIILEDLKKYPRVV